MLFSLHHQRSTDPSTDPSTEPSTEPSTDPSTDPSEGLMIRGVFTVPDLFSALKVSVCA